MLPVLVTFHVCLSMNIQRTFREGGRVGYGHVIADKSGKTKAEPSSFLLKERNTENS